MTKFFKLVAFVLLITATSATAQQTLKFGHINSTQLLSMMPETKLADSTLQKFGLSLEGQLKTMTNEYQSKISDYRANEATMAEPVKEAKPEKSTILNSGFRISRNQLNNLYKKRKRRFIPQLLRKRKMPSKQ